MKDQVFSGKDVADAVALAARTLGVPTVKLHYVVLEAGGLGTLGRGDNPARIAVLLDAMAAAAAPAPAPIRPAPSSRPAGDYRATVREVVRALAKSAEVDLAVELEEKEGVLIVSLQGEGRQMLLEDEGEPLRSFEQVIARALVRDGGPRRLIVRCEGYQDVRGEALQAEAQRLAAAVLADGRPRTTEPLNSYERRLIHVALADHADVKTFSVGEGPGRRVTVALRTAGDSSDTQA